MLVTVATYTDPVEAHIVRGRLETEGVETFVAHEHHIWANWFLSTALGGVKLQVAPADVPRAREILDADRHGEHEALLAASAPEVDRPACPACRSTDVVPWKNSRSLSLFAVWLLSLPLPYRSNRLHCRACGHAWNDRQARRYSAVEKLVIIVLLALLFAALIQGLYILCRVSGINPACLP